jgi:hypothetical protein
MRAEHPAVPRGSGSKPGDLRRWRRKVAGKEEERAWCARQTVRPKDWKQAELERQQEARRQESEQSQRISRRSRDHSI